MVYMVYIQHKVKKIFKKSAFLLGLAVLFILNLVSGQNGDSERLTLSQKAQDILIGLSQGAPLAHADTPPPPPGCGGGGGGGCGTNSDGEGSCGCGASDSAGSSSGSDGCGGSDDDDGADGAVCRCGTGDC